MNHSYCIKYLSIFEYLGNKKSVSFDLSTIFCIYLQRAITLLGRESKFQTISLHRKSFTTSRFRFHATKNSL